MMAYIINIHPSVEAVCGSGINNLSIGTMLEANKDVGLSDNSPIDQLGGDNSFIDTFDTVTNASADLMDEEDAATADPLEKVSFRLHECAICGKDFCKSSSLYRHMRNIHKTVFVTPRRKLVCAMCTFECENMETLTKHMEDKHDLNLGKQKIVFPSTNKFLSWKKRMEKVTRSVFVKKCGSRKRGNVEVSHFYCHRSGYYKPDGTGKRSLKKQGSNKIQGTCPAYMKVISSENTVEVHIVSTHVGHTLDLGRMTLTFEEKKFIATRISNHIPVEAILDEIRTSGGNKLSERIQLVTRKDILNIAQEFNLKAKNFRSKDANDVDSWVESFSRLDDESPVLYYKCQGEIDNKHQSLRDDDFLLVIMSQAQKQMLISHGNELICIDSTNGADSNEFEMTALLILDDKREAFPACFIISNRQAEAVMTVAFEVIHQTAKVVPDFLMTDDTDVYHNAWIASGGIMKIPQQLICSWLVEKAWREKLEEIKNKRRQREILKVLRSLMMENDSDVFPFVLHDAVNKFLSDDLSKNFGIYFRDRYSTRTQHWAYCHHRWDGGNANSQLERMHQTLKDIYFKGKREQRLDKSIRALMKFVQDKHFHRLIAKHKGAVPKKAAEVQEVNVAKDDSVLLQCDPSPVWNTECNSLTDDAMSVCRVDHMYSKDCVLMCKDCNVCIHEYNCSCVNSIETGHVHYVCQLGDVSETENVSQDATYDSFVLPEYSDHSHYTATLADSNTDSCDNLDKTPKGPNSDVSKAELKKKLNQISHIIDNSNTPKERKLVDVLLSNVLSTWIKRRK